ncbi:hypothetical protein P154DRAFT_519240, partial [Amniculicola lignicola CBS 123094]
LTALKLYIKRLNNISIPLLIFMWHAAAEQIRYNFFKRYITINLNKIRKIKQKLKDIK